MGSASSSAALVSEAPSFGSLASMGGRTLKKKPVLVLAPEELEQAHLLFQQGAAEQMGEFDPEQRERAPSTLFGLAPLSDDDGIDRGVARDAHMSGGANANDAEAEPEEIEEEGELPAPEKVLSMTRQAEPSPSKTAKIQALPFGAAPAASKPEDHAAKIEAASQEPSDPEQAAPMFGEIRPNVPEIAAVETVSELEPQPDPDLPEPSSAVTPAAQPVNEQREVAPGFSQEATQQETAQPEAPPAPQAAPYLPAPDEPPLFEVPSANEDTDSGGLSFQSIERVESELDDTWGSIEDAAEPIAPHSPQVPDAANAIEEAAEPLNLSKFPSPEVPEPPLPVHSVTEAEVFAEPEVDTTGITPDNHEEEDTVTLYFDEDDGSPPPPPPPASPSAVQAGTQSSLRARLVREDVSLARPELTLWEKIVGQMRRVWENLTFRQ